MPDHVYKHTLTALYAIPDQTASVHAQIIPISTELNNRFITKTTGS